MYVYIYILYMHIYKFKYMPEYVYTHEDVRPAGRRAGGGGGDWAARKSQICRPESDTLASVPAFMRCSSRQFPRHPMLSLPFLCSVI